MIGKSVIANLDDKIELTRRELREIGSAVAAEVVSKTCSADNPVDVLTTTLTLATYAARVESKLFSDTDEQEDK